MSALGSADYGSESYLNWIERSGNGGGIDSWSEVYVRDGGSAATTVNINYYNADGSLQDSQSRTIAANGFALFDTRLDGALGTGFTGYARVTQNGSEPLGVAWLEANNGGARLAGFNGLPASHYASRWACADARRFDTDPAQYTYFQIVNVDAAAANVSISLYDPLSGALKASNTLTLAPGNQANVNLKSSSYNAAGASYDGLALVQSTNGKRLVTDAFTSYDALGQTGYNCTALP